MKNYILTLILSGLFVVINAQTPTNEDNFLMVRVIEGVSFQSPSKIMVTDGQTIIKTTELSVITLKNLDSNLLKIATALNEVKNKGYRLVSSSSNSNTAYCITDYVLEKSKSISNKRIVYYFIFPIILLGSTHLSNSSAVK